MGARVTFYKGAKILLASIVFLLLTINIFSFEAVNAMWFNSANIPASKQSHTNGNPALTNNYRCANGGNDFEYAYHSWTSRAGTPGTLVDNTTINVPVGVDYVDLQFNVIGNHCTSNMDTGVNNAPTANSQILPIVIDGVWRRDYMRRTRLNDVRATATLAGTSITNPPADLDIPWHDTTVTADPRTDRFYAKSSQNVNSSPVNYPFRVRGLNSLPAGQTSTIGIIINYNPVARYEEDSPSGKHFCVNAPRNETFDINDSLAPNPLCNSTGWLVIININRPNRPPTGTLSAVCEVGTGRLTIRVRNVTDPDGGDVRVRVSASGAGGPTNAQWTGTGNHDFGPYNKAPGGSYTISGNMRDPQTGGIYSFANVSVTCSRPPLSASCSVQVIPASPMAGDAFTVRITVTNNSAAGAINLDSGSHPLSITANRALTGLNSTWNYGSLAPGATWTSDDTNVRSPFPELSTRITVGVGSLITCFDDFTTARPPVVAVCNILTSPSGPFEIGQSFDVQVFVDNNSSVYATPMSPITHPVTVSVTPAGVTGVGGIVHTAEYQATLVGNTPNTHVATDAGITASSPNNYTISASVGSIDCPPISEAVGIKPYFKVFGGDVAAGGNFENFDLDPACTAPVDSPGNVYGFARNTAASVPARYAGASSQFSITALMNVNGVYSASQRADDIATLPDNTYNPKGLTFANSDVASTYGGNFNTSSSASRCIMDYFGLQNDDPAPTLFDAAADFAAGNGVIQRVHSGPLNLSNITVGFNTQLALFVDGDVTITGTGITFEEFENNPGSTIPGLASFSLLPNFDLVARNIYINPSVERLDGGYIAQPTDESSTDGVINTCNGATLNNMYGRCNRSLTINGSLVARKVIFGRVAGTLEAAAFGELPADFNTGAMSQVAEVINYTPYRMYAPSALHVACDDNGDGVRLVECLYPAYKELPPVY